MHHDVAASERGRVGRGARRRSGTAVMPGDRLVVLEPVVDTAARADAAGRRRRRTPPKPVSAADLAESIERHAVGLDEARPDAVARRRARRPAHGTGERRRPRRRRLVRRVRPARHRRPAPPPRARRPDRQHAGRRPRRRHRHGQRRAVRARAAALHRHVVRLHRARRHAGHAEPPQEGPPVRARRAAAPADRVLHRGRRRPPRRHRRHRAVAASTAWPSSSSPSCPASCRSSASTPATASPATPRSSAAATSSSPPRTRTSAWAARR